MADVTAVLSHNEQSVKLKEPFLFCAPEQRLSGAGLGGQPAAAPAECGPGSESSPGWVGVVVAAGWGPLGLQPYGAGQRTGRGI